MHFHIYHASHYYLILGSLKKFRWSNPKYRNPLFLLIQTFLHMFYGCRMIFERKELLSVPWSSLDQTAVLLALVLSQVISYLLLPSALQLLHPAGLNLSLLSSNFITLAAATSILMYKVSLSSLIRTSRPLDPFKNLPFILLLGHGHTGFHAFGSQTVEVSNNVLIIVVFTIKSIIGLMDGGTKSSIFQVPLLKV